MSVCDLDQWIREIAAEPVPSEPIPPMMPARPRRPLPRRTGHRRRSRSARLAPMLFDADPDRLTACHLDDYAAAWAQRFMLPVAHLARHDGEHDGAYRQRLLTMIAGLRR